MPRLMCGAQRKYKVREATQEVRESFPGGSKVLLGLNTDQSALR